MKMDYVFTRITNHVDIKSSGLEVLADRPKLEVPSWGGLIMRIMMYWCLNWGPPCMATTR